MTRRTDVLYSCRDCKVRQRGAPGRMFCPDCGGELRMIGSTTYTTTTKGKRRNAR